MGYANYRSTIANGEPLYWFLTWEDYTSAVIFVAITSGATAVFLSLSKLTTYIKAGKDLKEE
jgi:hypothetical protein